MTAHRTLRAAPWILLSTVAALPLAGAQIDSPDYCPLLGAITTIHVPVGVECGLESHDVGVTTSAEVKMTYSKNAQSCAVTWIATVRAINPGKQLDYTWETGRGTNVVGGVGDNIDGPHGHSGFATPARGASFTVHAWITNDDLPTDRASVSRTFVC